jgi:hypothetical protein
VLICNGNKQKVPLPLLVPAGKTISIPDQSHHHGSLAKEQEVLSAAAVDSTCLPTTESPSKEQQMP